MILVSMILVSMPRTVMNDARADGSSDSLSRSLMLDEQVRGADLVRHDDDDGELSLL